MRRTADGQTRNRTKYHTPLRPPDGGSNMQMDREIGSFPVVKRVLYKHHASVTQYVVFHDALHEFLQRSAWWLATQTHAKSR